MALKFYCRFLGTCLYRVGGDHTPLLAYWFFNIFFSHHSSLKDSLEEYKYKILNIKYLPGTLPPPFQKPLGIFLYSSMGCVVVCQWMVSIPQHEYAGKYLGHFKVCLSTNLSSIYLSP